MKAAIKMLHQLEEISARAFSKHGLGPDHGLRYFSRFQFNTLLSQYSGFEIIAHQVRNFSGAYVLDFLLCNPEIWDNFNINSWECALAAACPRRPQSPTTMDLENYMDVVFLCKYLQVDGICLFLSSTAISENEKSSLVKQVKAFSHDLVFDELDREDLDGDYYVSAGDLARASVRLVSEGLKQFDASEKGVEEYVLRVKL